MNKPDIRIVTAFNHDTWLHGLYFKCPVMQDKCDNPCDCQLHEIRKKSYAEFVEYVKTLTIEEKEVILNRHFTCSNNTVEYTHG